MMEMGYGLSMKERRYWYGMLLERMDRYYYDGLQAFPRETLEKLHDALVAGGATEKQAKAAIYRIVVAPKLLQDPEAMDAMASMVLENILHEIKMESMKEAERMGDDMMYVSWYTKEGYLRWGRARRGSQYDSLVRSRTSQGCRDFAIGLKTLRERSKAVDAPTTEEMYRILCDELQKGNLEGYLRENGWIRTTYRNDHPIKTLYVQTFGIIPSEPDYMYIYSVVNDVDVTRFDGDAVREINKAVRRRKDEGMDI